MIIRRQIHIQNPVCTGLCAGAMYRDGGKKSDTYSSIFALRYLQFAKETNRVQMKLENTVGNFSIVFTLNFKISIFFSTSFSTKTHFFFLQSSYLSLSHNA